MKEIESISSMIKFQKENVNYFHAWEKYVDTSRWKGKKRINDRSRFFFLSNNFFCVNKAKRMRMFIFVVTIIQKVVSQISCSFFFASCHEERAFKFMVYRREQSVVCLWLLHKHTSASCLFVLTNSKKSKSKIETAILPLSAMKWWCS